MRTLVWTPSATRDIARLHSFLAANNPDAASRAVQAIRRGVEILGTHPEIGRPASRMPREFRDWFVRFGEGAYVVRYRYDGTSIVILRVRHGREAGY